MLNTLGPPLRSLGFAAGGAAIAWAWFTLGWWPPVLVVAALFAVAVAVQKRGERLVATAPARALQLMETRIVAVAVLTAASGALALVVTVALVAPAGAAKSTEELLGAVTAAIVAFLSSLFVSADDADDQVGEYIRVRFQSVYVGSGPRAAQPGQVVLRRGSVAHRAVMTSLDYGLVDWSRKNRRRRIDYLVKGIAAGDVVVAST